MKIGSQADAGLGACKRRRRAQTVVPRGEEAGNLHVRAAKGARRDAMSFAGGRPLGLHSLAIRDGKYPFLGRAQALNYPAADHEMKQNSGFGFGGHG